MKIFLATNSTRQHVGVMKKLQVENMLISFHYFKDIMLFEDFTGGWYPKNLIIDSGAFSVWTQKGHIDIDAYIKYCKDVKAAVEEYNLKYGDKVIGSIRACTDFKFIPKTNVYFVNLDVLPGSFGVYPTKEEREQSAIAGWANMEYMENAGVKVIHVFHQHEDFKWLRKLMEHQEYIGISPANDESQASKDRWMAKCFSIVKTNVKCHGFAVTSCKALLKFPFFSCDSTSWLRGAKYGSIPVFKNGVNHTLRYKDIKNLNKFDLMCETSTFEMLNSYEARMTEGVLSHMEMEKFITEKWFLNGITWN